MNNNIDSSEILTDLNPPQFEAVTHTLGPLLVLAGAGSGKTRVLTRRIAHLVRIHGVDPSRILAVTFTNKATEEMRERLRTLLGEDARPLWISTFHSAALRILRHYGNLLSYDKDFIVYDEDDSRTLIKRIIKELNIDEKKHHFKGFLKAIDRAKNDLLSPEQYYLQNKHYESQLYADVYDHYQRALKQANAMDFGDLLFNVVELFSKHSNISRIYQENIHFVLVDEFQDTNKAQYLFLQFMTKKHRNVFVVGDDDQSIYAFRGADPQNIIQFSKDFPNAKVIKLEQNYRSSANILEAAHAVIEKNSTRSPKKLWTAADSGDRLVTFNATNEEEEARFVASQIIKLGQSKIRHQDIAIFYRTNAQSRALEEALMDSAIPFRIYGGLRFYDRKEIKDILAYLRLLANQNDNQAFQRIVNNPPRGIGAQTVQAIFFTARQNSSSLLEASCVLAANSKPIKLFVELINDLEKRLENTNLSEMIKVITEKTGYIERLKNEDNLTAQSRLENIEELKNVASSFDNIGTPHRESLTAFLDRATLSSSNETSCDEYGFIRQEIKDTQTETVSLMTLHLAKGLEFPVVFLTGMEEGLLPHNRSKDDPAGIEEERRLCYVGITRAKQKIYLTHAKRRGMFSAGSSFGMADGWREVSRFLYDIPGCFIETKTSNDNYELMQSEVLPKPFSNKNLTGSGMILATADQLLKNRPETDSNVDLDKLPPLSSEATSPGTEVFHPTFGKGVIETVDGDCDEDPQRAKIRIRFDCFQGSKTLVFGKSKLREFTPSK